MSNKHGQLRGDVREVAEPSAPGSAVAKPSRKKLLLLAIAALVLLGLIIIVSQSRMIQGVSLLVTLWSCAQFVTKRIRSVVFGIMFFALALACIIPNPFSQKFLSTFSSQGVDKWSTYPDDRFAFWRTSGARNKTGAWKGYASFS